MARISNDNDDKNGKFIRVEGTRVKIDPNNAPSFWVFFFIALALILASTMVYNVDRGEAGVEFSQFSGTKQEDYGEGWQLKAPWPVEKAETFVMREKTYRVPADAASNDLQEVTIQVAVRYKIEPGYAHWIYQHIDGDYEQTVIAPVVQESVKSTTAQFEAENLIQERTKVREGIKETLNEKLSEKHIVLVDVELENIEFSTEYWKSIEAKVVAEQEALKEKNLEVAEGHRRNQTIIQAQGQAESARIISEQLQISPSYVPYLFVQRWNGVMPSVMAGDSLDVLIGAGSSDLFNASMPTSDEALEPLSLPTPGTLQQSPSPSSGSGGEQK